MMTNEEKTFGSPSKNRARKGRTKRKKKGYGIVFSVTHNHKKKCIKHVHKASNKETSNTSY